MPSESLRSPILHRLLRWARIQPNHGLRVLEVSTDTRAGASAAELAAWSRGSVVSLSAATKVTGAARAVHGRSAQLAFHSGPLIRGWPAAAPYDLVLSWQVMDRIPHAWVVQCAPGGQVLSGVWLRKPGRGGMIGMVGLRLDRQGLLTWPPRVATGELVDQSATANWLPQIAMPDSDHDSYGYTCGCGECVSAADTAALQQPVVTGDRWVRPIHPAAPAHLTVLEYPTVGKPWLSRCGIAFNPAISANSQHRRCAACTLLGDHGSRRRRTCSALAAVTGP